jgi:hypothetical protein
MAPPVMSPLDSLLTAAFGALAHVRRARALHPDGAAFAAVLRVPGGRCPGVPLLDAPGEHRALVRVWRAAGTPWPLPDGLGLALRVPDAHRPGRHQDVLLTTTIGLPLLHHLVVPTTGGVFGQCCAARRPPATRTSSCARPGPSGPGARPGRSSSAPRCRTTTRRR